ncbi:natterin-3-like [Sebastes umbrosus]|uniref:natterin-3-like n=1 Tax=Sebastes umbrosus TaxID=72105 RepID=UPI00189FF3F4|nr:natterin-3-like [Sebastes umbrosus]
MAKPVTLEETNLKWESFNGSIPDGAVSIYNGYEKRTEYVAKYGNEPGFFCPDLDPYCHYSYGGKELLRSPFEILVNKDDFDSLKWKYGSWGSVPANAVYTSPDDMYVGKNEYGLGKVHVKYKNFYHAWGGKEYEYKEYQVLTFNPAVISEHISDVKYKTDDLNIIKHPPEILTISVVENKSGQPVKETATLSNTTEVEQRWDTSFSMTAGFTTSITAGIPEIASANVGFSVETTLQLSEGTTHKKSTTYSVAVECKVPPHHSCKVSLVAYKYGADIPYTARLKRTYKNGDIKWTSITGTYKGVNVGEVRAVVDPCEPLPALSVKK